MHDLQFAYQEETSITMCTWGALETIGYFVKNDSEVFTCLMDNTKAYDKVRYSILFSQLLKSSLPPIFCRFLLTIYINQKANVRWKKQFTEFFTIKNGVRQGAVLSGFKID